MTRSAPELRALSDRFFAALNKRDFDAAAGLYASDAIYESPALPVGPRLSGRETIIEYFKTALEDSDFRLRIVEQFTGVNMVLALSSEGSRTFVDVLRVNDDGRIVEHLEVIPQASACDSVSAEQRRHGSVLPPQDR